MDKDKHKQGLSVHEIENLGKKYRFEIFFILYFIIAALFAGAFFFSLRWSIFLTAIGGIIGVFMPKRSESIIKSLFGFVFKQEKVTRLVLACCGLVVALFVPPLVFFILGFVGGANIYNTARNSGSNLPPA